MSHPLSITLAAESSVYVTAPVAPVLNDEETSPKEMKAPMAGTPLPEDFFFCDILSFVLL